MNSKHLDKWQFALKLIHFSTVSNLFLLEVVQKCFFLIFGGHESFLWSHWYPCFELLVTSPLGLKARVDSALFELDRGIHVTLHVPWDSPLVQHLLTSWWPAWQLSHLFHIPARHWWDSKPRAIMPPLTVWDQADTLPTELSRLGLLYKHVVNFVYYGKSGLLTWKFTLQTVISSKNTSVSIDYPLFPTHVFVLSISRYTQNEFPIQASDNQKIAQIIQYISVNSHLRFFRRELLREQLHQSFLPPANEVWGKVIFSEVCVKNSVHRRVPVPRRVWSQGGVCSRRGV